MPKKDSPRFYDFVVSVLAFVVRRVCRVRITGLEHLPKTGGVILVPNHVSHADPVILGVNLRASGRRTRALAKESLFRVKGVGAVLHKMGHIPVFRASARATEALSAAIASIRAGEVIAVYPEGTVPKDGSRLGVFKSGAARLALATGAPIIPVAQLGAQRVLPAIRGHHPLRHLFLSVFKRPEVLIAVGQPIYASAIFAAPDPEDRGQVLHMTELVREEVDTLLTSLEARAA